MLLHLHSSTLGTISHPIKTSNAVMYLYCTWDSRARNSDKLQKITSAAFSLTKQRSELWAYNKLINRFPLARFPRDPQCAVLWTYFNILMLKDLMLLDNRHTKDASGQTFDCDSSAVCGYCFVYLSASLVKCGEIPQRFVQLLCCFHEPWNVPAMWV